MGRRKLPCGGPVRPWPGAWALPEKWPHIIEAHSVKFSPHPPKSANPHLPPCDIIAAGCVYMVKGLEMEKVLSESLARIS